VAVLESPVLLLASAPAPVAVLESPVVFLKSASKPMAVLPKPVVRLMSASSPRTVLSFDGGVVARLQVCYDRRLALPQSERDRCSEYR
jgi:hypothetical protein